MTQTNVDIQNALYSYLSEAVSVQMEMRQLRALVEQRIARVLMTFFIVVLFATNSTALLTSRFVLILLMLSAVAYLMIQLRLVFLGARRLSVLNEELASLGSIVDTLKKEADLTDDLEARLIDRRIRRLDPTGKH